jgi:hypothetical protein
MTIKKHLVSFATVLALGLGSIANAQTPKFEVRKGLIGRITNVDEETILVQEYDKGNLGSFPFEYIAIKDSSDQEKIFVWPGPSPLRQGDSVYVSYTPTNPMAAYELAKKYFRAYIHGIGGGQDITIDSDGIIEDYYKFPDNNPKDDSSKVKVGVGR